MKERLDEQTMALRAAKELQDGWYVNLGFGVPTLVSNFIPEGRTIYFQAECGILGYGPIASPEEADEQGWWYVNAAAQPVLLAPGTSVFDYGEAFDMIRSGHLDLAILGGLQVSEKGDLANWQLPTYQGKGGTIGGAMDLAEGPKRLYVIMTHTEKNNKPKIMKKCTYALTGKECVDLIFTDLAVIEVTAQGLLLKEIAPGWTVEEVQQLTEPKLIIADNLKEIEL